MFNKSKIMRRAHSIRRENGCTMSEALRRAWVEVKRLVEINNRLFDLNMIDFQSYEEKAQVAQLGREAANLNNKLAPKSAEEIAAQAQKNQQAQDLWEEAEDIRFQLGCIVRSKTPDWELHKALRARLKEIA